METFQKVLRVLKKPYILFKKMGDQGYLNRLSDEKYLKLLYHTCFKKELDLNNPKTYNEKLQWLKLYDRNPKYTQLVDKYEVRNYVKETIGEKYLISLLGVWNSIDEIDWGILPNQFVLKATHDSGGIVICNDKKILDIEDTKEKLENSMKKNYYYGTREWPYKNVRPRIIAEKYLEQVDNDELRDYRFFCFNGEPKFIAVDYSITDKNKTRRNLYDLDWNMLPARISYPNELEEELEKPDNLNEMIFLSKKLSKDIPHVRVDFYNIENNVIFGELTFYHQSGFGEITPSEFTFKMGDWIDLPNKRSR